MKYTISSMNTPTIHTYCTLILSLTLIFLAIIPTTYGQKSPQQTQEESIVLKGGTLHIGNGEVIKNGNILFEEGKIQYIGTQTQDADRIIDVSGQHIYPGIIAPNTDIGLVEIEAVRATRDFREVGEYNPHLRALIAYNTDSRIIPTIRSNGILLAEITPRGGIISGQSSVVQLDAWNWEDAKIQDTTGVHLNWPSIYSYDSKSRRLKASEDYEKDVQQIEEYFELAMAYGKINQPEKTNLRFKALNGMLRDNQPVFVHADSKKALLDAIDWSTRLNVRMVLVGAEEAWKIASILKEKEIPVIIASTQRLPRNSDTKIEQPYRNPMLLEEAGVTWCFSHNGSWDQRNLPFQAGQAVGMGLDEEKAIQALTLSTANILGIDHQYGSLETGKSATLVISDGNILDPKSSIILQAFIDGREVDLDNKQKQLYRKFGEKHGVMK